MNPNDLIAYRHAQRGGKRQGKAHKGISQKDLATILGVSTATVQSWEQGRYQIPQWVPRILNIQTKTKG